MNLPPQQEIGWFRSPIAAGMLCGVLAGAVTILMMRVVRNYFSNRTFEWVRFIFFLSTYFQYLSMLSTPAVCRRSLKIFSRACIAAMLVLIAYASLTHILTTYLVPYLWAGTRFSRWYVGWIFVQSLTLSLITAFFMGRLFGLRPVPKSVYGYSAFAVLLITIAAFGLYEVFIFSKDDQTMPMKSEDLEVCQTMLQLIGNMILTALPAIAIERALKIQSPKQSTPPQGIQTIST